MKNVFAIAIVFVFVSVSEWQSHLLSCPQTLSWQLKKWSLGVAEMSLIFTMYKPFHLKIQNFAPTMEVAKITMIHLLYFTLYLPFIWFFQNILYYRWISWSWVIFLLKLWCEFVPVERYKVWWGWGELQLQLQLQWWGEITMTVVIKISNIPAIGIIRLQFG